MTVCDTRPVLGDKVPIRKMQALVNKAGGYKMPEDGYFGPNTDGKVKDWQTRNGLPANGLVDAKVWPTLCDSACKLRPVMQKGCRLRKAVTEMQAILNNVGSYHIPEDGVFGSNTERTVKDWQTRNGLQVDGVVGAHTWVTLCESSVCKIRPTLQKGSSDKRAVREMQAMLNDLAKYGMPEDGIFGSNTDAKVRDWQRKNKLHADGIVGTQSWPSICDRVDETRPTMAQGYDGYSAVRQLQVLLNKNGGFGIAEDGIFGGYADRAVREWQTRYGINVDGIVGDQTWPSLLDPSCELRPGLRKGSKLKRHVTEMQARLNKLGGYRIPEDGDFGGHTEDTVRNWQTRNGIYIDGYVAKQTWSTLCAEVGCKKHPHLENGSTNKRAVREMQALLNKAGGYSIPEDGLFGGNTEKTVKDWQKINNRKIDGIVEGELWETLCECVCDSRPVLGDKDSIMQLQTMLNEQGGYGLEVDGLIMKDTERAVKDWQEKYELFSDGIVDDETWATLCVEHRPTIPPVEANEWINSDNPPFVIDVRRENQYNNKGHVPTSINLPFEALEEHFAEEVLKVADRNTKILIYGRRDKMSVRATDALENAGFNYITQIEGGWYAWENEKPALPIEN